MKKIVFLNPGYGLPVPSVMGGAVEELETILLEQNERCLSKYKFYFVQKDLSKKNKENDHKYVLKNSEIVKIKCNRLLNLLQRIRNKILLKLIWHKNKPFKLAMEYNNKAFSEIKRINPDVIIFEGQIDANIDKYIKHFGKDKLFMHLHYQELEKNNLEKYVSGFIAPSNFIYDDYMKFLGDKSVGMQNMVLMNCVNEDRFVKTVSEQDKLTLKKQLGFSENDFIVVYCGRICEIKGVDKLIEAINKTPSNIKLLIIGSIDFCGKKRSKYLTKIQKLVTVEPGKVKLTGYVKNSELYKYYQVADLQVVPSIYEEAAGLVVIEGQMSRLPQIITKSGGMGEYVGEKTIIVNRDDNLVNSLYNSIIKLSSDMNLRQSMIKSGFENSKKYTKENYYKNFIDLIQKIKY